MFPDLLKHGKCRLIDGIEAFLINTFGHTLKLIIILVRFIQKMSEKKCFESVLGAFLSVWSRQDLD